MASFQAVWIIQIWFTIKQHQTTSQKQIREKIHRNKNLTCLTYFEKPHGCMRYRNHRIGNMFRPKQLAALPMFPSHPAFWMLVLSLIRLMQSQFKSATNISNIKNHYDDSEIVIPSSKSTQTWKPHTTYVNFAPTETTRHNQDEVPCSEGNPP